VSTCLKENARRVNRLDARLMRPQLMPALFSGAERVLELFQTQPNRSKVAS